MSDDWPTAPTITRSGKPWVTADPQLPKPWLEFCAEANRHPVTGTWRTMRPRVHFAEGADSGTVSAIASVDAVCVHSGERTRLQCTGMFSASRHDPAAVCRKLLHDLAEHELQECFRALWPDPHEEMER